jgi:Rrf2 family protein
MWLNSTAQTALRAVVHLAEHGAGMPLRTEAISNSIDSPRNYLSKTLHVLAREGILRSTRGPKGGFELVGSPADVSLAMVVEPFEPGGEKRCLFGKPKCGDTDPCPAHHRWSTVAASVEDFFQRTTIADLVGQQTRDQVGRVTPIDSQ